MLIGLHRQSSPSSNISAVWHSQAACIAGPHLQARTQLRRENHWDGIEKPRPCLDKADFTVWSVKSNAALCNKLLTASFFFFFYPSLLDWYLLFSQQVIWRNIDSSSLSLCLLLAQHPITVTACLQQIEIRVADFSHGSHTEGVRARSWFRPSFYFHFILNVITNTVETISE